MALDEVEHSNATLPEPDEAKGSLGIQSVEIGMTVLTALSREPRPLSLAGAARLCGMPRTKAHRYLTSLERAGYVEREPGTGHYRLGANSVQLGLAALAQLDFSRLGSEMLPAICRDVGETVFVTIWGQHGATIVRWEETGQPIAVNVRVGSTMPLLQSATGRVFGAFLAGEAIRPFLKAELAAGLGRPLGILTEAAAEAMFADVHKAGLGRASGSFLASIGAVAVPVFGEAGKLAGTITSLGLIGTFADTEGGHVVRSLRRWSARLSARLGAPAADRAG